MSRRGGAAGLDVQIGQAGAEGSLVHGGEPTDMKSRQRHLGQFFTPQTVVDFALETLVWLSGGGCRRLVDPACGDGIFLRRALELGLVELDGVCGVDKDATLADSWSEWGQGPRQRAHLQVADGLLSDLPAGAFDWVVGNPPYAGTGLKEAETSVLQTIVERYELARIRTKGKVETAESLRHLPIEVLFVERFVSLCRPGGYLAIVLPEGIFSNTRWRFVREWLLKRVTLQAIVSLPRRTFSAEGITAKTCLAIAEHQPAPEGHQILLAEVDSIGLKGTPNELPEVLRHWQKGEEVASPRRPWRAKLPERKDWV